jgi:hypothetical protein
MRHILRMTNRPKITELTARDQQYLDAHFDINQTELQFEGDYLDLHRIDSIEVVPAARSGPSGWIVRRILFGGKPRFHIGIYYGRHEIVMPNVTLPVVRYVLQSVAYFARTRIGYEGPEGLVPLSEDA